MEQAYAVLTGDLIASSKASPLRLATTMANLAETGQILTKLTGSDPRFTRFRGDGWQMLIADPGKYLLAVALILARLRATPETLATRIAIGVGTVNNPGTTDLSDARGAAFIFSGQALDGLKRDRNMVIASAPGDPVGLLGINAKRPGMLGNVELFDGVILDMFSFIAGRWTAAQAQAVAMALENHEETQAAIAARLGITRQALNLRLTGAGYGPTLSAIRLTDAIANMPNPTGE